MLGVSIYIKQRRSRNQLYSQEINKIINNDAKYNNISQKDFEAIFGKYNNKTNNSFIYESDRLTISITFNKSGNLQTINYIKYKHPPDCACHKDDSIITKIYDNIVFYLF